jgi:hypothetical protein
MGCHQDLRDEHVTALHFFQPVSITGNQGLVHCIKISHVSTPSFGFRIFQPGQLARLIK